MDSRVSKGVIPFTRAGLLLPFVTLLADQGVPSEKYLRKAKIPRDLLADPEAAVPLTLVHRFVREATKVEGIESIGFHAGRLTTVDDLGVFGSLLLRSNNVFEYLTTGIRFISAVTSGDHYWLEHEGELTRFCFFHEAPGISESDKQQSYLFTLVVTVGTLRQVCGEDWCPQEVCLPFLNRTSLNNLSDFLPQARILTGTKTASFLFPRSLYAHPFRQHFTNSKQQLSTPTLTTLPTGFSSTVELLIESLIPDGNPGIGTAAEAAGMSVRTLRRRLAECGTTYSELVARTRIRLAERWLAAENRPITEIAFSLGYTDRSNFTRAFRRFNGLSPREYRQSLAAGEKSLKN